MSMKSDIASLSEELLANPHLGTDLGGGLRKKEIEELLRLNGLK